MTKEEIILRLDSGYKEFTGFITALNEKDLMHAPVGKWNAGQQLDHLIRAVSPLSTGLMLPKFILKMVFGKANRASKSYEELVKKYLEKLDRGGKASGRFIPKQIDPSQRQKSINHLLRLVTRLGEKIDNYSENQLDAYTLPHPLLGKLTIREMMYFTIYHAEHHLEQGKKNIVK
ncbi:MAG: DinB family protein [Chitinophagaceae bacterium]|nr:DinB family protein [Chitinophagaceae bacterium]